MFRNYLKIAFRSFLKQKLTSSINIIGLSVGIACASLGYIFVQHELSYDRFHEQHDHIYWMSTSINSMFNLSGTPGPLAPGLKEAFPEVSESFRLQKNEILVQAGNEFFKEQGLFVDPNFFSFFSFDLLEGNPDQIFPTPNSLLLTSTMAEKYFGRENPIGKTLSLQFKGKETLFSVAGIAADSPQNTSIPFNFLLPLESLFEDEPATLVNDWTSFPITNFIRLRKVADLDPLNEKIPAFVTDKLGAEGDVEYSFTLRALEDYHLQEGFSANGLSEPADMTYVRILGIIAVLILLVACFNFMNLASAQGSNRLLEVGVRRVLGAERPQLIGQFLAESVLLSLVSLVFGAILLDLSLPFVSQLTGFPLTINWTDPSIFLPLLGIATLTGLLAGTYPSLLFSRLKAIETFKSNFKAGGNNWVTKGSLVFQFALSIGLLSCTFIMYQQQQFIKEKNLGFDKEQMLVIPTQFRYNEKEETVRFVQQFKNEVNAYPDVLKTSGVSYSFNRGNSGIFIEEEDGSNAIVFQYDVDQDYLSTLGIQLVEGRNFDLDQSSDFSQSLIVNEAFIKHYDVSDISTYKLPARFEQLANMQIIGVVEDYNYLDLRSKIKPMVWRMPKEPYYGHMLVKISPTAVDATIAQLRSSWQTVNPSKPFEFFFLDEDIQQQYVIEERWNKAISGAAILAIVIACMGLFGLIALILIERTKEIGIRKVLGASVPDITWLISKQFVILLGIAALVAIPVSWWAMQQWLENFAFKIDIKIFIFVAALGITLFIALLTTSLQSAKAALRNPVESLRYE